MTQRSSKAAPARAAQRAATRVRAVDAALAIIDRDGIEAATLDAIAAALGLTKQGLYYHFASKEALLAEAALSDWRSVADAVHTATAAATSAEDALEALVRTYVKHYAGRLQRYRLATQGTQLSARAAEVARAMLAQIHPLNDLLYGAAERKLRDAQAAGLADPALDPRRLAFAAHMAAMGFLTMKLMASTVGDPLRHGDDDLVAELCRAMRASVRQPD